jgi:hypothetical protein
MRTLKYLLLLLLGPICLAQTGTQPNCTLSFSLNSTHLTSSNFNNTSTNCQTWTLTITSSISVSGFTLTFKSAPAASNTAPGSFVTYAGSTVTGSNPMTAVGTSTFSNGTTAIPWVNLTASGITGAGTIIGVLQGWNTGNAGGGGGGGGGCTDPCPVVGTAAAGSVPSGDPVQVAGWDGTDVRTLLTDASGHLLTVGTTATTSNAAVSVSSSGLTQILAASAGKVITIYHISLGFASGVNFQLEYGTGAACGTGTTALTGVYQTVQGIALDVPFTVPVSQALCVNLGSGVAGGGLLVYTQI